MSDLEPRDRERAHADGYSLGYRDAARDAFDQLTLHGPEALEQWIKHVWSELR